MIKLNGRFWLEKDGKSFLGSGRIELLKRIESTGSMNAAAKEMKMSYKAAWDRLNSMNELAQKPLLERQIGGKGGGGTKLTSYAYEMMKTYEKLEALHKQFIERFSEAGDSPEHLEKILNKHFLNTSARNQLLCKIIEISYDNIYAKITLRLSKMQRLVSAITTKSMQSLNLKEGDDVYAIIKSNDVKVSKIAFLETQEDSNVFEAEILGVESDGSKSELRLSLERDKELIAVVNSDELEEIELGKRVFVSVKHSAIILGM